MEKSSKFKSRKFLLCLAQVLVGIGTSITGMCIDNDWVVLIGAVCTAVGTGIYTFCEAWVDKAAVKASAQSGSTALTDEEIDAQII